MVGRAVVGVEVRRGLVHVLSHTAAAAEAVSADVKVEKAISIIIGERRHHHRPLFAGRHVESRSYRSRETTAFVRFEQQDPACRDQEQILIPVVVVVAEQRGDSRVKQVKARCGGDVLERSVAQIAEQSSREAARLADKEVIPSVAIVIARGNAVEAIEVNPRSAVQMLGPITDSAGKLRVERCIRTDSRGGDLVE